MRITAIPCCSILMIRARPSIQLLPSHCVPRKHWAILWQLCAWTAETSSQIVCMCATNLIKPICSQCVFLPVAISMNGKSRTSSKPARPSIHLVLAPRWAAEPVRLSTALKAGPWELSIKKSGLSMKRAMSFPK